MDILDRIDALIIEGGLPPNKNFYYAHAEVTLLVSAETERDAERAASEALKRCQEFQTHERISTSYAYSTDDRGKIRR